MGVERVIIRGTSSGLRIILGAGNWDTLLHELESKLRSTPKFFRGGRVALAVGPRRLVVEELRAVGELLDEHGVSLWAVEGEDAGTRDAACALGLETIADSHGEAAEQAGPAADEIPTDKDSQSLLVHRTLRSGQKVRYGGHVVVIGDVNPGAEIVAAGDVVVWGKLRGTVHAGAEGDESAVVCALYLAPTQLRIGNHIARSPEDSAQEDSGPEMAFVHGGQIVAEPWEGPG
jgi:septum site-determining protein MinC